jgi:hypothetical protein
MKVKESNKISRHFMLPQIKKTDQNRFTPHNLANNRSLPKITPSCLENLSQNSIPPYQRQNLYDKKSLKEKIKSIYKKKKSHLLLNSISSDGVHNAIDEANITSSFQKEIQKNLILIKREK